MSTANRGLGCDVEKLRRDQRRESDGYHIHERILEEVHGQDLQQGTQSVFGLVVQLARRTRIQTPPNPAKRVLGPMSLKIFDIPV